MTLLDEKTAMRAKALEARKAARQACSDAADRLVAAWPDAIAVKPGMIVSGYFPIGTEIDPRPLMALLAAQGAGLALPVMLGAGQALEFRQWSEGDDLDVRGFGVSEPLDTAAVVRPDIVLLPLLAFDRTGGRLGYGAGFYDRTLDALSSTGPVTSVGVAFAEQAVDQVPVGPHDETLDWILTPSGAVQIAAQG